MIERAPLTDIDAVVSEDLNPVVLPVAYQDAAVGCDPYPVRR